MRLIAFAFAGLLAAYGGTSPVAADEKGPKPPEPSVQILTANIDRTIQDGRTKNTFVITGESKLAIKNVRIFPDDENDARYEISLVTDDFTEAVADTLIVKVKDKVFVPTGWGGNGEVLRTISIQDVDQTLAEILNGGPLPAAPKESFRVEYWPHEKSYPVNGPVKVGITLTNVGTIPLTIHWGSHGGGNWPTRDTQLSFTAMLDGAPVPQNPKPLPDGFIQSPFVSQPKTDLKRSVDLTQWIQFEKPGKYLIDVTYMVEIMNPDKDAGPMRWNVSYRNQFSIQIGD